MKIKSVKETMKNFIIIFLLYIPLSAFCLAKADFSRYHTYSKRKSPIESSVWNIRNLHEQGFSGTGFFIEKNLFITNFHGLLSLLKAGGLRNIVLVQEDDSVALRIEKVMAVAAFYDLALLKIRRRAGHYLTVSQQMPEADASLFVPGYFSGGVFGRIEKSGKIFYEDDQSYVFPVDHCNIFEVIGGPVLNESRKVVGISFQSEGENILAAIKLNHLKEFISNKKGLNCSHFKDVESCTKAEMENLKHMAKKGHPGALSHLIRLMYYIDGENNKDLELVVGRLLEIKDPIHAKTQHLLARMYYSIGTKQNIQQALLLWKKAARQSYVLSQYSLANKKVGKDSSWAVQWLLQAASLGYVKAQYDLGKIYYKARNFEPAFFFLNQAARQGYAKAKTFLRESRMNRKLLEQASEKI